LKLKFILLVCLVCSAAACDPGLKQVAAFTPQNMSTAERVATADVQTATALIPQSVQTETIPAVVDVTPTSACPEFYTENFDGSTPLGCWGFEAPLVFSNEASPVVDVQHDDHVMNFTLNTAATDAYVFYSNSEYKDVFISATFTNHQPDPAGVALICNSDEDGWYEARVATDGAFSVWQFSQLQQAAGKPPYTQFGQGTTKAIDIESGKANTVRFGCVSDELILDVNGTEVFNQSVRQDLDSGKVGVGVISTDTLPVEVDFNSVSIVKP
jgi:hypothetical protein